MKQLAFSNMLCIMYVHMYHEGLYTMKQYKRFWIKNESRSVYLLDDKAQQSSRFKIQEIY